MLEFILYLILVVFVLFPLVRFVCFFLFNARSGHLAEIVSRTSFAGLLRAVATAIMADVTAIALFPMAFIRRLQHPGDGTPIVLVHGLFHNSSAWTILFRRLERAGFSNIHTYQYDSFAKGFDEAVDGLERLLDSVLGNDREARVLLVGHSLGGMVCRKAASQVRFRNRIAGLLTLGSPHHGSSLAVFGPNPMSRGLIPGRYIPRVVSQAVDPACLKLAIYTLTDDYVCPLDKLSPARVGWKEVVCSPMGHVWMLFSREIADAVISFLHEAEAYEESAEKAPVEIQPKPESSGGCGCGGCGCS